MTAFVILALIPLGQQARPASQKPAGLMVRLEVDHWKHQMYDPLFVRVAVANLTSETVQVGPQLCRRAGYMIIDEPFRYRFESEYVDGFNKPLSPLAPGDERIVDYEILQMPPIRLHSHDFWKDVSGGSVGVQAEVSSGIADVDLLLSHSSASRRMHFAKRSEAEADFINQLYAKLVRRCRENVTIRDVDENVDVDRPAPEHFGLHGFPYTLEVPELGVAPKLRERRRRAN